VNRNLLRLADTDWAQSRPLWSRFNRIGQRSRPENLKCCRDGRDGGVLC
jgi:hypothetical protein